MTKSEIFQKLCVDETRMWQRLTCLACVLSFLSFILNITALAMIGTMQSDMKESNTRLRQMHENQAEMIQDVSDASWKNITKQKRNFQKIIAGVREDIESASADRKALENEITQIKTSLTELKTEWRSGCSENGLTNGSLCYVYHDEKVNYTEAVTKCRQEGGSLAKLPNNEVLDVVTQAFSSPFFVDARFNQTSGKWKTSLNKDASFLPWKIDKPGSDGDCAYAFRSGFKTWHCHAMLHYLCEF